MYDVVFVLITRHFAEMYCDDTLDKDQIWYMKVCLDPKYLKC